MSRGREMARWAPRALVGLLALGVYAPSLGNGFALDDVPAVAQDERIRDLGEAGSLLLSPYLTYMPVERSPYRPVTTVSYAISWAMGGGGSTAFHAFNLAAHAAASLLLLSLLLALGAPRVPASAAAALFAAHPVHVEAVAGVVGRADVLATLFSLAAVRLYLSGAAPPWARIGGVAACYLLALGAKESAVVLPLLLVLVELLRGRLGSDEASGGGSGGRSTVDTVAGPKRGPTPTLARVLSTWPTHAALAAVLALFLAVRTAVLGGVVQLDVASYIVALPASLRLSTAVANLAEVVRLLLFPLDLSPEYGPAVLLPAGFGSVRFWIGAAALGGAVAAVAWGLGHRSGPGPAWIALGVAWVGVSFALVSNLILPMPMWLAERTLYLPSVGLALAVVGVAQTWKAPGVGARRAAAAAVVLLTLVGGAHAARRSAVWDSDETLFTDLVDRHPESFRAQWWLGGRMVDAGDVRGGIVWLARAVESSPNSVLLTLDYARALLLDGRAVEAEALVRPIGPAAHPSRPVFLAQSLVFQGRTTEAAEVVREGLRYFPGDARLTEQARLLGL